MPSSIDIMHDALDRDKQRPPKKRIPIFYNKFYRAFGAGKPIQDLNHAMLTKLEYLMGHPAWHDANDVEYHTTHMFLIYTSSDITENVQIVQSFMNHREPFDRDDIPWERNGTIAVPIHLVSRYVVMIEQNPQDHCLKRFISLQNRTTHVQFEFNESARKSVLAFKLTNMGQMYK